LPTQVGEISLGGLGQGRQGRPGLEQVADRVLETLLGAIEECLLDGGPVRVGREQSERSSHIRRSRKPAVGKTGLRVVRAGHLGEFL